jgi:hypothetical protein
MTQRVTQQTQSHANAPVLPLDLAIRVCNNVNMKPRIAAICAIVAFATCGGRAPAQFPRCAYMTVTDPCLFSIEAQGECQPSIDPQEACQGCQPGAQAVYVENARTDGQVKVTIRVTLWDVVPGNSPARMAETTFTDQVLTLAAGERRKLGCHLPAPQTGYTWSLEACQPL